MRIETFQPEHIAQMTPREPDLSMALSLPDPTQTAKMYSQLGPAFTGFVGSVPIACAGIVIQWPGLGTGWALTTALVSLYPFSFHRAIKENIERIAKERELRRVQIDIPDSHVVSRRWALRLGFRKECAMPFFGPTGETWLRYVRLFQ